MTISLLAVEIKHERRIRLVFSSALAGGAFGTPGPANYVITSLDGRSLSPSVNSAMLVPNNPNVVELALSADLANGAIYSVAADATPGADSSTSPVGIVEQIRYGLTAPRQDVEPAKRDRDRLLYGVDLLWNGDDYQETPNGDLERVSGTPNVTKAMYRLVEANGLPWAPDWGVGAREFVDSPSFASGTLRGKMASQILADARVKDVAIVVEFADEKTFLHADVKLNSGEATKRVSLVVPNQ